VAQAATALGALAVFLGIYALLLRRARRAGRDASVRWGWLAAIVGCAAVALLIGVAIN
jgi:hypothetical protein